jgi:hypothetical protein
MRLTVVQPLNIDPDVKRPLSFSRRTAAFGFGDGGDPTYRLQSRCLGESAVLARDKHLFNLLAVHMSDNQFQILITESLPFGWNFTQGFEYKPGQGAVFRINRYLKIPVFWKYVDQLLLHQRNREQVSPVPDIPQHNRNSVA